MHELLVHPSMTGSAKPARCLAEPLSVLVCCSEKWPGHRRRRRRRHRQVAKVRRSCTPPRLLHLPVFTAQGKKKRTGR